MSRFFGLAIIAYLGCCLAHVADIGIPVIMNGEPFNPSMEEIATGWWHHLPEMAQDTASLI